MADQIPDFIDGDLNLSNRVKAAWLNDVNDATYRANTGISGATPNRTLLSKLSDIVSVRDFGALGDGVTDDTAAIQAVVNSAGTGGITILFPKPSVAYLISSAIDLSGKSNLTFEGTGGGEFQTSNSTKLIVSGSMTGPFFTCNTANATRAGGFTFKRLTFEGNSQNVDAFYIHGNSGSNLQARMIEFSECWFQNMRTGLWLGDFTNEAQLTTLLGVNVRRCIFTNIVRPIVADAGGFDGLHLEQVWILDGSNRMTRGIDVFTTGTNLVCDNVWISPVGTACTRVISFANPDSFTMRDSAIETAGASPTFVGIYMAAGAAPSGVILDNIRINHQSATAVAVDVSSDAGMQIRSSRFQGDVNVGATCKTFARNVQFTSTFGFTGTTTNVWSNGLIPFGTAALPSLGFFGDADTGIWRRTGNVITLSVGGNDRAEFQDTGLVLGSGVTVKWGDATTISGIGAFVSGITAGNGAPNNANGANGDFYFRGDGTQAGNTVIYHKQGGSWVALITT